MGLLFIYQHNDLCLIPLIALWQGNSLPSVQRALWYLFSIYFVLTTNFTYRPWLTFSGTFPLVLTLKSCWVCRRLTALLLLGGCKVNLSASDSIPAASYTTTQPSQGGGPCVFEGMIEQVSWISMQRAAVFPEVLDMEWEDRLLLEHCSHWARPACVLRQRCQSLENFEVMLCL